MCPLTYTNAKLSEKDFQRVSDVIYKHCGINLHDGKKTLVSSRLAKQLRLSRFYSFKEYIDYVLSEEGKHEFYKLVDSISTNLTSFFRENVHFEYLRNTFLPKLIEQKAKRNSKIRAWSAGCSTGEEPYSMAITLIETLQKYKQTNWNVKILASDISTRALERAQIGTYDKERLASLGATQKQTYFVPNKIENEKVYQVRNSLKKLITFRYLNLMEQWPFNGPFDFIFCRNVMIYFNKETQEKLINRFYNCLAKGGLLCIGHSESLAGVQHNYKYVMPATYIRA